MYYDYPSAKSGGIDNATDYDNGTYSFSGGSNGPSGSEAKFKFKNGPTTNCEVDYGMRFLNLIPIFYFVISYYFS